MTTHLRLGTRPASTTSRPSLAPSSGSSSARQRRTASALLVVVLALGVALVPSSASSLVLVNSPGYSRHVGQTIAVGVWYRACEGGPRAFRVAVKNPAGNVVFATHGLAPTYWKIWRVPLKRVGTYRTIYWTKRFNGEWIRTVTFTRVRR